MIGRAWAEGGSPGKGPQTPGAKLGDYPRPGLWAEVPAGLVFQAKSVMGEMGKSLSKFL